MKWRARMRRAGPTAAGIPGSSPEGAGGSSLAGARRQVAPGRAAPLRRRRVTVKVVKRQCAARSLDYCNLVWLGAACGGRARACQDWRGVRAKRKQTRDWSSWLANTGVRVRRAASSLRAPR